jgi:multidrug efflux system outer membrane protein
MRKLLLFFLLLGGCHLGPRYEAPSMDAPLEWKGSAETAAAPDIDHWWKIFADEPLDGLERQAVEKNPDLYVALEKIAEARAIAGVAKSTLYPQVNLKPSFNNVNELIELYGVPQGLFPGLKTISRVREQTYQLPVAMSYEVDLWGKFRGTYNAAAIYAEAQEEAMRMTLLTLTSELASNYFNIRSLDTQIQLLEEVLRLRKETTNLVKLRYQAGLVSAIDLFNTEKFLTDTDAEYQDTLRQRRVFENAIASLIGIPASEFALESAPLVQEPPEIPAGIPSDMLLRRPDVAQAERSMASFHAFIGVAYATYFPAITLTSGLGYSSPDLSQFLNWSSRLWQLGVNLAQVVFNGWRNRSYVDAAFARFREAKGNYESAVLTAFQEVEDALINVEQQHKQFDALNSSYKDAQEIRSLSLLRYEKGIDNYLDTLDAERSALDAERSWMNLLGQRYQSSIQLVKALGGGWESCELGSVAANEELSAEKN